MGFARVFIMTTDIALLAAAGFVLYYFWDNFPINIIILILLVIFFGSWRESGGCIAWKFHNTGG